MGKYSLLFLIVFGLHLPLYAQYSINGKVLDEAKEGLPYVTVRLLKQDSAFVCGTATDSLGQYTLKEIKVGNFLLSISSIGYDSQLIPVYVDTKDVKVAPVTLGAGNVILGEVEVKGQSFIRQKDKVLILPDKQQVKHAGTGYDLLYNLMIPSIQVDRHKGKVTTFGGDVTLYIDGRKVDYREIQSLRPRDIEKVEYYDAPTGKYAGDVASINYITKRYKVGGYLSLDGKQTIGYLNGDYNVVAKLSHGNTSYTFFGGQTMQKYGGIQSESQESFHFQDYTVTRDYHTLDALVKNNQQYAQLNVTNENDNRTLTAKASLVRNDQPDNYDDNEMKYAGHYNQTVRAYSLTDQISLKPTLDLYGNFNLPRNQQLEASLAGSFTHNDYSREYTESDFLSHTDVKERFYTVNASVQYHIPLHHQNTLTAQLVHNHKVSASTYTGDYDYWQHLWSAESLFFLVYNQNFGKKVTLAVRPGLSSLQYHLHGASRIGRIAPRLNVRLIYRVAPRQQLRWIVAVGNTYPEISILNSVDQTVDFLQVKRGNPEMANSNIYSSSLAYSVQAGRFNVQAMASYTGYTSAALSSYFTEGDKLISTYRDDGNYHEFSGLLSATWKASDHLHLKADMEWSRYFITGPYEQSRNNLSGTLNLNYFWNDFAVNVYGSTPTRDLGWDLVKTRVSGKYGASVSWSHKGWIAEIGTESPFTKHNREVSYLDTEVYNYYKSNYSRIYQQTGYVKLAYTIDFGRKTSRSYDGVDTHINSAIMKAK